MQAKKSSAALGGKPKQAGFGVSSLLGDEEKQRGQICAQGGSRLEEMKSEVCLAGRGSCCLASPLLEIALERCFESSGIIPARAE